MQQKGITIKKAISSMGRLITFIFQTLSGLKYQWPRCVANTSQPPKMRIIRTMVVISDFIFFQNFRGGQKLNNKGTRPDKISARAYFDIPIF